MKRVCFLGASTVEGLGDESGLEAGDGMHSNGSGYQVITELLQK